MHGITATPTTTHGLVFIAILDTDDQIASLNDEFADFLGLPRGVSGIKIPGLDQCGRYAMHYRMLTNLRKTGKPQRAVIHGYSSSAIGEDEQPDTLRYNEAYISTAPGREGHVVWCSFNLNMLSECLVDLIAAGGALRYEADSLPANA